MGFDLTSYDPLLKEYYGSGKVPELVFKDRPLLAYLGKKSAAKFPGRRMVVPAIYGNPRAVSSSITVSLAGAAAAQTYAVDWLMTRVKLYNTVTLDRETMLASDGKEGAFMESATTAIDGAINAVSDRLAQAIYRSGYGEIGTIASISTNTVTLTNKADAYGVERGDVHVFSASLASNTLRNTGGTTTLTVTKVNRQTGVITYSANVSTITGTVANDYIFTYGDREDSATPAVRMIAGAEGWGPSGGPSATTWFGVDRTVDDRLQAISYNGASDDPQDAVLNGAIRQGANGRKTTHAFMSFGNFSKLVQNVANNQRFVDSINASVQFAGVTVLGPKGPIKVIPDQFCPANRIWLFAMDDEGAPALYHLGDDLVHIVKDSDGRMVLRQGSADGEEVRISFIGNLVVASPQTLGNVQVTAVDG